MPMQDSERLEDLVTTAYASLEQAEADLENYRAESDRIESEMDEDNGEWDSDAYIDFTHAENLITAALKLISPHVKQTA